VQHPLHDGEVLTRAAADAGLGLSGWLLMLGLAEVKAEGNAKA
jgi:hypothetical protein